MTWVETVFQEQQQRVAEAFERARLSVSVSTQSEIDRHGVVRCESCTWTQRTANMDEGMELFDQHARTRHASHRYSVGATFQT